MKSRYAAGTIAKKKKCKYEKFLLLIVCFCSFDSHSSMIIFMRNLMKLIIPRTFSLVLSWIIFSS